jgi:hypothetical protein
MQSLSDGISRKQRPTGPRIIYRKTTTMFCWWVLPRPSLSLGIEETRLMNNGIKLADERRDVVSSHLRVDGVFDPAVHPDCVASVTAHRFWCRGAVPQFVLPVALLRWAPMLRLHDIQSCVPCPGSVRTFTSADTFENVGIMTSHSSNCAAPYGNLNLASNQRKDPSLTICPVSFSWQR